MTESAPAIVARYLSAADAGDIKTLAECFAPTGSVVDEGETYRGHDAIFGWRESLAGKWVYTSSVTGSEAIGVNEYRVKVHVEGNFPGGVADLVFRFRLRDDLIDELFIAE
jgi:hypothetical protein